MKKTILWSALFTLIGTQVYAEQSQATVTPATNPAAATTPTPPPAPMPSAGATPTPPPAGTPAAGATPTHDPAPSAMRPVAPQPQQPNQAIPTMPGATPAQAPGAVINCDYKIPAQVKTVDQSLVLTWAQKAVMQAFSFNPTTIDTQMQSLQSCFTEQGWTGFSTALQKSGNIEAIKAQNLTVTSQITGPVLVNEARDNQWKLTVPVTVVYQNEKEKVSQLLSVDLTVNRKPNGDLGITQMIAAPRGSVTTKTPVQEPLNPENTSLDTRPKN